MAKKAALAKIEKQESKRLAAAARARQIAKAAWNTQQHSLTAGVTAFGLGFAENRGITLPTLDAIDPAPLYAVGAMAASMFIKDKTIRRLVEGVTDGLIGVSLYKAGRYGFNALFNYVKPAAPSPDATAGWGEEIIETGAF